MLLMNIAYAIDDLDDLRSPLIARCFLDALSKIYEVRSEDEAFRMLLSEMSRAVRGDVKISTRSSIVIYSYDPDVMREFTSLMIDRVRKILKAVAQKLINLFADAVKEYY